MSTQTDQELLADAMADLARAPRSPHTTTIIAKYAGYCLRCEKPIRVGTDIHWHNDFGAWVHHRCRAARDPGARTAGPTVTGVRPPSLCSECFTEHAGACW